MLKYISENYRKVQFTRYDFNAHSDKKTEILHPSCEKFIGFNFQMLNDEKPAPGLDEIKFEYLYTQRKSFADFILLRGGPTSQAFIIRKSTYLELCKFNVFFHAIYPISYVVNGTIYPDEFLYMFFPNGARRYIDFPKSSFFLGFNNFPKYLCPLDSSSLNLTDFLKARIGISRIDIGKLQFSGKGILTNYLTFNSKFNSELDFFPIFLNDYSFFASKRLIAHIGGKLKSSGISFTNLDFQFYQWESIDGEDVLERDPKKWNLLWNS